MRLHNVTASEVFNAMNFVFENENTPVRWDLKMNGNRPTAVLHVMPSLVPLPPVREPPREVPKRMIYFVGDLLGEEKSGGMTMEQLVKTVSEVYQMSYEPVHGVGGFPPDSKLEAKSRPAPQRGISSILQFHKEAQLLIVNGTIDQLNFFQQTLSALRQRAELERLRSGKAAVKEKTQPARTP